MAGMVTNVGYQRILCPVDFSETGRAGYATPNGTSGLEQRLALPALVPHEGAAGLEATTGQRFAIEPGR